MTDPVAPPAGPDPKTDILICMPWPAPLTGHGSVRAACDRCGAGITVSPKGMATKITRLCLDCAATRLADRPGAELTPLPGDERLLADTGADTTSAADVVDVLRRAAALHRAMLS